MSRFTRGMPIGSPRRSYSMTDSQEIAKVARLMRIEIPDNSEHIAQVQKMIAYFDILDSADVQDEEIIVQEMQMDKLRADEHAQYQGRLMDFIHGYRGGHIRAPKMI